jgi:hypothetical protein
MRAEIQNGAPISNYHRIPGEGAAKRSRPDQVKLRREYAPSSKHVIKDMQRIPRPNVQSHYPFELAWALTSLADSA